MRVCFCFWLSWPSVVFGQETCLLAPVSLEQRTQQATLLVEAKVTAQQSYWDKAHQNIYTRSTLEVYKILKGSAPAMVEVITEGGLVNNTYHAFSGTLQLRPQDQGIFFLAPAPLAVQMPGPATAAYRVYSSSQGFIRYDISTQQASDPFKIYPHIPTDLYPALQKLTNTKFKIIRANPALENLLPNAAAHLKNKPNLRTKALPAISNFAPDTITAGTGSILTIRGQNFGSTRGNGSVQFSNADNGGNNFIKLLRSDYISWTDTEIKVRVSSKNEGGNTPGSGFIKVVSSSDQSDTSTQYLVIEFAESQVIYEGRGYNPRLVNQNKEGGYTFQVSQEFARNIPANAAFNRALNTWSCYTGINWHTTQPTSLDITADDNVNVVRFDTGNELPAGVLARCISRYDGCGNNTPTQWRVSEMDMIFNTEVFWNFTSNPPGEIEIDFETVTLHELGHGHQLNHIIKPGAVMHYAIFRNQQTRRLDARTDVAGGQHIIGKSIVSQSCGSGRMIPQPFTNCPPPLPLLAFTAEARPGPEVTVSWTQINAEPTDYFVVERSKNAADWQAISTVQNTPTPDNGSTGYNFSDTGPFPGVSFYRLKLVNPDRTFAYSPLVRITLPVPNDLAVAPNPVTGNTLLLQYVTPESGELTIQVFDVVGRLHRTLTYTYRPNSDLVEVNVTALNPGLYVLVYSNGRQTQSAKFLKL